ncbi:NADH pyrophosphatase [Austwickia sp. TVS 96-490-7B]|uniref:NAD(+) diphosphatase n=1 Tax=Austwickia sp. TVS 96-490-7B TaxID=2830843 RepID=UPI001C598058|nr:NAD(+) diphosphatase [Austwickia sp. TVS 96-490-7B]MBW3085124.1 NADH pyrophosphatase [Austwickia sp. TVS 96-490-7B]
MSASRSALPCAPAGELWLHQSRQDRRGELRGREEDLAALWADPSSVVTEVSESGQLVTVSGGDGLVWQPTGSVRDDLVVWCGGDPARWVRVSADPVAGARPWRDVIGALPVVDAHAAAVGLALGRWHATHPFCPRCGAPTQPRHAGWMRVCGTCEAEFYPRTDPVVIMAVLDDADRICLVRGHQFASSVAMSCPAGFVDAAESLEDAVRREVAEELGLRTVDVSYAGSQPWPAAGQVMVAMVARVEDPALTIDPVEVAAARWFTRTQLREALTAGEVTLPPWFAAGRWLIEGWLGERVDASFTTTAVRTGS